jgi:gluconate 5-dehydrogenase
MVVGGSSGIGYSVAGRLASTHSVTALARRIDRLAPLEEVGDVAPVRCDVADLSSIDTIVKQAVQARGKIGCLVYCAGVQQIRPLRMLQIEDIRNVLDVNLTAVLVFGRLMATQQVSLPESTFCAITSIVARRPEPGILAYSVAKAGQEALIKGLARELAPRRAVGVAPGWLDTEMTRNFQQVYDDRFKVELAKKSPRGIATVEAVTDLIEFLISPKAAYITGQVVTIDGGFSL